MWYVYIDRTLEVVPRTFYVGIGSEDRVKVQKRNKRHTAIVKAYGIRRSVIVMTSDRMIAQYYERHFIAMYKTRHDLRHEGHWGANFTAGDGVVGRNHTLKDRRKISKSSKGRKMSAEQKRKLRIANGKPVVQYDMQGNVIARYVSQSEATQITGVTALGGVCARINGRAGGFVWRNEGDPFDYTPLPKHVISDEQKAQSRLAQRKPVVQTTLDGTYVATHSCALEAAKTVAGAFQNGVCRCCRGKIASYKGFIWSYVILSKSSRAA